MSDRTGTATSLTRRAIELIRDDEISDARLVLAEALELDPGFEQAWLWFAHIAENPGERRFCLERAAEINAESTAKQELPKLRRVAPVEPPEVGDIVPPPPPPEFAGAAPALVGPPRRPKRNRWIFAGLGFVAALAVVFAVVVGTRRSSEPIYLAVAGGMTGPSAASGSEVVNSARLYFDGINAAGGIDGRSVELLIYDDENDPERAVEVAREIIEDGRPMLVIGHIVSAASIAAGPIYAEAGIPVITTTANADSITADNPWYFRTIFGTGAQGFLIAAYVEHVLGLDHMTVIAGSDGYGSALADGVITAFHQEGGTADRIDVNANQDDMNAELGTVIDRLNEEQDPGLIVIAQQSDQATETIAAIRRAGIEARMLGGDSIGSNRFLGSFADFPEEQEDPGYFTDGLYAAAPIFMDGLSSESLRWFEAYRDAFDVDPTWRGATTFDAAIAAAAAIDASGIAGSVESRDADRQAIRDALAIMDSPDRAVAGLLGPIYFDKERATPRAAAFGVARDRRYSSAFEQLRPYATSANLGLEEDLQSGVAIEVNGQLLERQRIVFVGVNINEIGELDTANPSFFADFFIWFTYSGDDSATDIDFSNAVESADQPVTLGDPIRMVDEEGVTYALYRVAGRFKSSFEFQDFPFDQQHLQVSIENRLLPSSKLVYAIDRDVLARSHEERLRSGTNAAVSINTIPSWEATALRMFQESVGSTALMGDPDAKVGSSGIEYSRLTTEVVIKRDLVAFLVKNLLPLGLLAAITYVSLFFPHSQTGQRVAFAVSAILTTAVLLSTVTAVLPQVGYTVAIEWGFYAFILLSAICIIIGLAGDWFYEERRYSELRKLDRFSHIFYPAFVAAIVLAYVVRFGGS